MDSILITIKDTLGIPEEVSVFDSSVLLGINSAFSSLTQLGVGPSEGYLVTSVVDKWVDFIGTSQKLEMVKAYVFLKTKLFFDPPNHAYLITAIERQLEELSVRIKMDSIPEIPEEVV